MCTDHSLLYGYARVSSKNQNFKIILDGSFEDTLSLNTRNISEEFVGYTISAPENGADTSRKVIVAPAIMGFDGCALWAPTK